MIILEKPLLQMANEKSTRKTIQKMINENIKMLL